MQGESQATHSLTRIEKIWRGGTLLRKREEPDVAVLVRYFERDLREEWIENGSQRLRCPVKAEKQLQTETQIFDTLLAYKTKL